MVNYDQTCIVCFSFKISAKLQTGQIGSLALELLPQNGGDPIFTSQNAASY